MAFQFPIFQWSSQIKPNFREDLVAGLTLWALLVPQSVAYAKLANAPTPAAGLYCIILVLPFYALFASSRALIASPTTAVSVTFAGFLALMSAGTEVAFSSLVFGTAIAYFIFAAFKLGFITDFISKSVSMGYLSGLSIIVVVGQAPTMLGLEKASGGVGAQIVGLVQSLGQIHWPTALISATVLAILIVWPKLVKAIPASLVALITSMLLGFAFTGASISMVGALPQGLPEFALPIPAFEDLAVIVPAAFGLVVLASGEASVTAQMLANKRGERIDMNQQFFAFGVGNLVGAFFGSVLGTGASSASLVAQKAGARTLVCTLWASGATLLTVMFLTGMFAYLPSAFLAALVVNAVWGMLNFAGIWGIKRFSTAEMFIAFTAMIGVVVLGILSGLVLAMLINVLYAAYRGTQVKTESFGLPNGEAGPLLPLRFGDVQPLPERFLSVGLVEGQIYYASARSALQQAQEQIEAHPTAEVLVLSLQRMNVLDYTSAIYFQQFVEEVIGGGKKLVLTDILSPTLLAQIEAMGFDPAQVKVMEYPRVAELQAWLGQA